MDSETKAQEPQKPPAPVCPYCGLDPCVPNMIPVTFGILVGRIFVCENKNCRKIFNVELIGEERPRVVPVRQMGPPMPGIHP